MDFTRTSRHHHNKCPQTHIVFKDMKEETILKAHDVRDEGILRTDCWQFEYLFSTLKGV